MTLLFTLRLNKTRPSEPILPKRRSKRTTLPTTDEDSLTLSATSI